MAHRTKLKLPPPDRAGKPEAHTVRLGARGRVVLPAKVRKSMEVSEGDKLLFFVEPDGRVVLTTLRSQVRSLRGILSGMKGSAAELIRRERNLGPGSKPQEPRITQITRIRGLS